MAIRVSKSDVRKLMERMDEDGDGYVDYGGGRARLGMRIPGRKKRRKRDKR